MYNFLGKPPRQTLRPICRGNLLAFIITLIMVCSSYGAARISVMMDQNSEAHNLALEAFRQAVDKSEMTIMPPHDVEEQAEKVVEIAKAIMDSDSDLVLAIGTTATLAAKRELEDIPIVFCIVLNPVSSGIVGSMDVPGANTTGASLDIPVKIQFQYIKSVVRGAKSIGVIYSPKETGSIIREAAKVAESMNLLLVAEPISSESEVPDALMGLLKKVDVLWSVADGMVFTPQSIEYILLSTLRTRTPFMGLSHPFVKAGALFALSCDYTDIGKQAAEMADRILKGERAKDIPVVVPRKVLLSLNLRTADQIGLSVPDQVTKSADKVIK